MKSQAKLKELKDKFGPQVLGVFSGSIGVENLEMAGLVQRFQGGLWLAHFLFRGKRLLQDAYPHAPNHFLANTLRRKLDSRLYICGATIPSNRIFPFLALEENLQKGAKLVVIDPKRIPLATGRKCISVYGPGQTAHWLWR